MKSLNARVLDPQHLELAEPLPSRTGEWVRILIPDVDSEDADWQKAGMDRLLAAYDEQDAVYDEL